MNCIFKIFSDSILGLEKILMVTTGPDYNDVTIAITLLKKNYNINCKQILTKYNAVADTYNSIFEFADDADRTRFKFYNLCNDTISILPTLSTLDQFNVPFSNFFGHYIQNNYKTYSIHLYPSSTNIYYNF